MADRVEGRPKVLDVNTVPEIEVRITVQQGYRPGQQFVVKRFPVVMGRGDDCEVRLEDDPDRPTISRRHARLDIARGRITVEDLSTNGSWVESHHLGPGEVRTVTPGDSLWLGSKTQIALEQKGPGRTVAPISNSDVAVHPRPDLALVGAPTHNLTLYTLGRFLAIANGKTVPESAWVSRKAVVLLVYLADHEPRTLPLERLYEALWTDDKGTRQALQTAVSRVRQALRTGQESLPDPLRFEHNQYGLNDTYQINYDARTFEMGCKTARRLWEQQDVRGFESTASGCLATYQGRFLEGAAEDWVIRRRTVLEQLHAEASLALALHSERQGDLAGALERYQTLLGRDPGREAAHEGLIRCLARLGRRDEALRQYQTSLGELKRVLDVAPIRSLLELREAVVNELELPCPASPYA